ncbi:MAG TPA: potassium-transporting ATPase subunit KdpC [Pyrinomonadaceae bacterium]|nr:potassium-transporting ATPase subunit KdpC [Pyrinomonadaceae bacterium]
MKNLVTSILMVLIFTVLLGIGYPFAVTGLAQILFPEKANGSLIKNEKGEIVGSSLIGQTFTGEKYFHSRPSAAGNGYDASASSGSNLGPTSAKLIDRVKTDAETLQAENPSQKVPVELVTTSASGLDPHISPEAAEFQLVRVAKARNLSEMDLRKTVAKFTESRQFGIFGEPRVNVLLLNLELDKNFQAN